MTAKKKEEKKNRCTLWQIEYKSLVRAKKKEPLVAAIICAVQPQPNDFANVKGSIDRLAPPTVRKENYSTTKIFLFNVIVPVRHFINLC